MRGENWKKIHSSICSCKDLDNIDIFSIFIALIVVSDLHGRYYADPERIKAVCFYFQKSMTIEKINSALIYLQSKKMIKIYESEEKRYLIVVNHEKYNPAEGRKAGKSIFPEPAEFIDAKNSEELPNTPKYSKVIKSKSELLSSYDFESVYDRYPKKSAKAKCIAKMKASVKNDVDFANLNKALTNYIAMVEEDKAKGFEKRAWKDAPTFFNNWNDFIDAETETQRNERLKKEKNEKLEKEMEDKKAKFLAEHPEYKKEEGK